MISERLYLEDLKKELRYRDRRSVRRWCRNNNVILLSDFGSNKQYVLKEDFEIGMSRSYTQNSRTKGSSRHSIPNFLQTKVNQMKEYRPTGEYEKTVLSIFTSLL